MKNLFGIGAVIAAVVIFFVGRWSVGGQAKEGAEETGTEHVEEASSLWTCPMHPQIQLPDPGDCPICGMDLVPMKKDDLGPRQFAMSEASRKLASIGTTPVTRRFVTRPVRLVGKVDFDETVVKTIAARVPGRLDRLYVDYTGVTVSAGDHLVWLYSPELLTAQEELLESRKRLKATGAEESTFLHDSNLRAFESAKQKLLLWGLTEVQIQEILERGEADDHMMITSPVSGVVIHKALNEGDYVKEGTRIYEIADLRHLWIRLDAYEQDLPWILYGQSVTVQTEAMPGEEFEGWISFIDPVLDQKTRTIKVRVNVSNPEGKLKPGMFVRAVVEARLGGGGRLIDGHLAHKWICPMHPAVVKDVAGDCPICGMGLKLAEDIGYVETKKSIKPLVIPVSAVLVTGQRAVVYVQVPGKKRPTYEGREIVLGPRAGGYYIVKEGLQENENVVTKGAFRIDSSLQILAKPSMMSQKGEKGTFSGMEVRMFRAKLGPLFEAYLAFHAALAKDDAKGARQAVQTISETLEELNGAILPRKPRSLWEEELSTLRMGATDGLEAEGLAPLRKSFADISKAMLAVARLFGQPGSEVIYEAFCPMAFDSRGASWIQIGKAIHNPFFGTAMQSCGEIREEFKGVRSEGTKKAGVAPVKATSQPESKKSEPAQKDGKQVKAGPGPIDGIYASYLALQRALAGDDLAAGAKALTAMSKVADGIQDSAMDAEALGQWQGYKAALVDAQKAKDLGGVRTAFQPLSKRLLALTARFGHGGKTSYYQVHCPMAFDNKGADWIQEGKDVKNPFYGDMMLGCGSVMHELPARGGR